MSDNTLELGPPGQWRTARQEHHCDHCKRLIAVRERYWEYQGETSSFQSGDPFCLGCAAILWDMYDTGLRREGN